MNPHELSALEELLDQAMSGMHDAAYRVRVSLSEMTISQVNDHTIPPESIEQYHTRLEILRRVVARLDAVDKALQAQQKGA